MRLLGMHMKSLGFKATTASVLLPKIRRWLSGHHCHLKIDQQYAKRGAKDWLLYHVYFLPLEMREIFIIIVQKKTFLAFKILNYVDHWVHKII